MRENIDGVKVIEDGENNIININGGKCNNVVVYFKGQNNCIVVGKNTSLTNLTIDFRGNNHKFIIGDGCDIRGIMTLKFNDSSINIGNNVNIVSARLISGEGASVVIGDRCMLSRNIEIRSTDEHPIFSVDTGRRINQGEDVIIGNHVWVGEGVSIVKGVHIGNDSVIATRSVVTKKFKYANALLAGNPAVLKKVGITWDIKMSDLYNN